MEMLAIVFSIFLIAFIPRFFAARKIDMTWDEGTYVFCGASYIKNLATFNFSPDAWNLEFHPPIMMYLYGMAYATYVFLTTILKHGITFNFKLLYQEGIRLFAGRRALLAVRLPSVILGSLSCVLTYFISLDLFKNEIISITAAILLALAPGFVAWSSLAMLESGITFFYTLTIWTLLQAMTYSSVGYLIISGISLGLAFGSKETGFGVPLVVLPWSAFLLLRAYAVEGLTAVRLGYFFLLWLLLGFVSFYAMWPWLWKNPMQFIRNLRASYKALVSWKAGWSFYITNLLATTPIPLAFLYGLGLLIGAFTLVSQPSFILLLSWAFLPLLLMSMPFAPKRGGAYELAFILPSLSILAGFAISKLAIIAATFFGFYSAIFLLLSFVFIGLVALECATTHPHYVDYYNFIALSRGKFKNYIGWWGEGMGDAIRYVDEHAPFHATVWIYGPKSTAFYHSKRVSVKDSDGNLFYARVSRGFNVRIDADLYTWRRGDLRFYFPYYYPEKHNDLDFTRLKTENVSHIVVYQWAIYDPLLGADNYKIISALQRRCKPVYVTKIKDLEVCWVYEVKSC